MNLAGKLLTYVLAVGVPFLALAGGVIWLVQPGAAVSQEARPAPLPPRIADSIARKQPFPVEERKVDEPRPEPVRPVMQQANVSLAPASVHSTAIRPLRPPATQPSKRRGEPPVARMAPAAASPAAAPASLGAVTVSGARSDSPY